jgi:hypothetical protein
MEAILCVGLAKAGKLRLPAWHCRVQNSRAGQYVDSAFVVATLRYATLRPRSRSVVARRRRSVIRPADSDRQKSKSA